MPIPTIAAVATAFHPDERLAAVVEAALKSCVRVVVVDNTPGGGVSGGDASGGEGSGGSASSASASAAEVLGELAGVTVLRDGRNRGLAGALNAGVAEVGDGAEFVLFLDQDSVLTEDLVLGLASHFADASVGIAAPAPWDEELGRFYEPGTENGPDVAERDVVITSGMLVRRGVLEAVGSFRTEFFVDHVDNDFCLRVRAAGYRILRDKRYKLAHSLGQRKQHRLAGVSVASSRHPTWRLYWIARNGTVLVREHRKDAPEWARNTAAYLVWWFLLRMVIEAPRGPRAVAMVRGFRDGVRGRVGRGYLPPGAEL